jgi:hypothetical protein
MRLWLDDIRDPAHLGRPDWVWAKTAKEAVDLFRTGDVSIASLDHDLSEGQMVLGGYLGKIYEDGQMSGYDVVLFLEQHPQYWPELGVRVHSANPAGKARMEQVIIKWYGRKFV